MENFILERMSLDSQIKLKQSSILSVPINNYEKDFTFIVNGVEFKTSRLQAELLSTKISEIHVIDPTIDRFTINTHYQGDFSNILNLIDFEIKTIPEKEIPFIIEIMSQLGSENYEIKNIGEEEEITKENVITIIKKHEAYPEIYHKQLEKEILFASKHFDEIIINNTKEINELQITTIEDILKEEELRLKDEDQLLQFINDLYLRDSKYSILYSKVIYSNVTTKTMKEFVNIIDMNDINNETWKELTYRLIKEINTSNEKEDEQLQSKRYMKETTENEKNNEKEGINFEYSDEHKFSGIIKYLTDKSSNNIENEINITASSFVNQPSEVVKYGKNSNFCSENTSDSWICFDFKEHRIVLTHCQIQSVNWIDNWNPKSWVIEGSQDNNSWETLDEQKNCSYLKLGNTIHAFKIENQTSQSFRYIRLRQTDKNWYGSYYFSFRYIEFYGKLI